MSVNLGFFGRAKDLLVPRGGIGAPMAPAGAKRFRVGSFIKQNPLSVALPGASVALEGGTRCNSWCS